MMDPQIYAALFSAEDLLASLDLEKNMPFHTHLLAADNGEIREETGIESGDIAQ